MLLAVLALHGAGVGHNVLAHVVVLAQVEHLPDLAGTLGAAQAGLLLVGESGELALTLLHNHKVQNGKVLGDDAPTDRLAAALTCESHDMVGRKTVRKGRFDKNRVDYTEMFLLQVS